MRDCYQIKCGQLNNGLRFYTQHDRDHSKELAVICVMAGSMHGVGSYISHLVEHCICNELPKLSQEELDLLLWRTTGGPDDNIYITTDRSVTTYGPADTIKKKHNRLIFPLFAEMIKNPFVSEDTLLLEKAAIHNEHYLRGEDAGLEANIDDILLRAILSSKHPASEVVDGDMKKVQTATVNDVKNHHRKYYVPANIFVVFLGPSHQEVKLLVEREFGDWGKNWGPRKNQLYGFKKCRGRCRSPIRANIEKYESRPGLHQHHVIVGFPTTTYTSTDSEALDVLARILSGRMYHELRTKNHDWGKGCYRAPVFTHSSFTHGFLGFHFATLDENYLRYGINAFYRQCDDICKQLVRREELDAWRGYILDYEYTDAFQRGPGNLMEMIITAVANGDLNLKQLHERGDKLKQLTRHQILYVAKKYLTGPSAKVIISPK
ncbi:MAG: pitrilysin family protein [Patescibacteria group bacterium]